MKAGTKRVIFLSIFCLLILALITLYLRRETQTDNLQVIFIDVGQGDATFIESPTGTQVLIDGGRDASVLRELSKIMGYFDKDIDLIVATHPDMDHIAGLIDVLNRYTVHTILMTENESDTPAFASFLKAVREEHATIVYARRGQVFDIGSGAQGSTTLRILFPDRNPSGLESNMASIVAQLRYGESEFMFTGDSPKAIEEYLVSLSDSRLQSDVLKAGHHGSRTSSAEVFVEAVSPTYAIFSAGKDNSYGHPHKEVVNLFVQHHIETKNTADQGSIFMESDGKHIWFK